MSQFRKLFLGMTLVSGAFVATACGPQSQPEKTEPTPTTETSPTTETTPSGLEAAKCDRAGRTYVSRDPVQCLSITWACSAGQQQFLDDCGCGCE
ncbi:hypothetical protein HPC49_37320 [Pyxidicoccus fallax]|uniref:Lipoprotein n=1 Tax=Pyxidicoccus fallax TaxID=394095 RepID=A0A848LUQ4_9BACT|nr:hypothetical protein [Pyxidicoccus fallax]NMO21389.1 hypothetical protein [Pyxidicoccus fallax]NPC83864.1 hypothetical protein [Pyxidicoccus fallax]